MCTQLRECGIARRLSPQREAGRKVETAHASIQHEQRLEGQRWSGAPQSQSSPLDAPAVAAARERGGTHKSVTETDPQLTPIVIGLQVQVKRQDSAGDFGKRLRQAARDGCEARVRVQLP